MSKTRIGSTPASYGAQSTVGATDFPLSLNQSSMPFAQALHGSIDPRVPRNAEMEQDIHNLQSLFNNPQELGFRIVSETVPLPVWFTRFFPLQPATGDLNDQMFTEVIANDTTMDPIDDLGMPSAVSYNTTTRKIGVQQVAKSIKINYKQLMTNAGHMQEIIGEQLKTVFRAFNNTMVQCGHMRIQESPLLMQTLPFTSERDYATLMMTEVSRFALVSRRKNGLLELLASMFEDRAMVQGASQPTIVVLSPGTKELQAHGGENNEYWRSGPKALRLVEGEDLFQSYKGATIFQGKIMDVRSIDGPVMDPMKVMATFGLHFTVPARSNEWGCDNRSPKCDYTLVAHDARLDRLESIGFSDLLAANPYYNKDGSLNRADLRNVLQQYSEMERQYRTVVPKFQGNRPMIDPHIATMGDVNPEPYIASMIGESLECYFSEAKLDRMVQTATRRVIEQASNKTIQNVQWLREKILNAYNGSRAAANLNRLRGFIKVARARPAYQDAGVDIYTRENTDRYGILSTGDPELYIDDNGAPAAKAAAQALAVPWLGNIRGSDMTDAGERAALLAAIAADDDLLFEHQKLLALEGLEPRRNVLPDGAGNFSWAAFFNDNSELRPGVSQEEQDMLRDAVLSTFVLAREVKNIFDLDSKLSKAQERNPLCTLSALPFGQMPLGTGRDNADVEELELIAIAQNCFFFVGQPLLRNVVPGAGVVPAAPANADEFAERVPMLLDEDSLTTAMFGAISDLNIAAPIAPRVAVTSRYFPNNANLLARMQRLFLAIYKLPESDVFVKQFFETTNPADVYAGLVRPFLEIYENTRAAPRLLAENDTPSMAFANLLHKQCLAPDGDDPTTKQALTFVNIVKDLLQTNEQMYSAARLRQVLDQTASELKTLQSSGMLSAAERGAGFDLGARGQQNPAGARIVSLLTPFVAHPTKIPAAAGGIGFGNGADEISFVNPVNSRQRLRTDNRMYARGVGSVRSTLGTETIFDHPHLSSGATSSAEGSGDGMMHGGAGFTNPVTGRHELSEASMRQTQVGSALFSPAVLGTAMLNKTFAERITAASSRTNMLTRAVQLLALCSPFNANLFRQMHDADVEPPVTMKVFYPFVQVWTGCAYVGTDNVGISRMEYPNTIMTMGETGYMIWRLNVHHGVGIINQRDISVAHNTIYRGYIGGMSVNSLTYHSRDAAYASLYDQDESAAGTQIGDGFVTTVGVSYKETSPVLDITGVFMPQSHQSLPPHARNAGKFFENPQYPGALFHNQFLRNVFPMNDDYSLGDHMLNFHEYRNWAQNSMNTICHRAKQWRYDTDGQEVVACPGWGLGEDIVPGRMARLYAGKSMLNTEALVRTIA